MPPQSIAACIDSHVLRRVSESCAASLTSQRQNRIVRLAMVCCCKCRRMYDHITLVLPQLPPGVSMAEVVQDSEEAELIAAAAADTVSPAQVADCAFWHAQTSRLIPVVATAPALHQPWMGNPTMPFPAHLWPCVFGAYRTGCAHTRYKANIHSEVLWNMPHSVRMRW